MNSTSNKFAWVEWNQPFMPWDCNFLKVAFINKTGEITLESISNITLGKQNSTYSYFQPTWLNDNELIVAEDTSGWWNLIRISFRKDMSFDVHSLLKTEKDFAVPQWISGMSTIAVNRNEDISL